MEKTSGIDKQGVNYTHIAHSTVKKTALKGDLHDLSENLNVSSISWLRKQPNTQISK